MPILLVVVVVAVGVVAVVVVVDGYRWGGGRGGDGVLVGIVAGWWGTYILGGAWGIVRALARMGRLCTITVSRE